MSVRERIFTIRLMEKVNTSPAHAKALGVVVVNGSAEPEQQTVANSANPKP